MLDGVTAFPAEFAARYRERGYWEGRPLFDGFTGAFAKYADRYRQFFVRNGQIQARYLPILLLQVPLFLIASQVQDWALFATMIGFMLWKRNEHERRVRGFEPVRSQFDPVTKLRQGAREITGNEWVKLQRAGMSSGTPALSMSARMERSAK